MAGPLLAPTLRHIYRLVGMHMTKASGVPPTKNKDGPTGRAGSRS